MRHWFEAMTTTVTEAVYRMRVDGSAAVDAAARSVDGLAVSEEKLTRATRATEQGFERLLGRLDPAIRAHQQYQQALERVERFTAAGIGTDADRARAVELITQRYQQALGAIGRHSQVVNDNSKKVGLNAYEMKNLGFQINDVATMLAMGQSPFQIMASQGGQVYQILAGSQGGVTGAVKGLAASVTSFLGPLGLMVTGFAAVTAAAYAFYQLTKSEAPTAEKLLAEHDRLLKIVKDSYDKVTNSARNWYEQSKAVTQLQLLQQELDLRQKLREEVGRNISNTTRYGNLGDFFATMFGGQGERVVQEKLQPFEDALLKLYGSFKEGTPNVREFVDEVARIALLNPALQKLGAELVASMGDASKFAQLLQQTQDMIKGIASGSFDADQRGRLGLGDPSKATVSAYDQLIQRTKDRIEQLRLEAQTAGQTGEAVLKLRLQHEAERAAKKSGIALNQEYIDQLKEEYAAADRLARVAQVRANIEFDRATMGLSPADTQIAQQLRDIYGNDIPAALASSEAAAMRLTDAMREGFQGVSDVVKGVFTAILTGKNAMDALIAGLDRLADKLASAAFENLLTGALTGNPVQMAIGAAQAGGALVATAFGNNLKLQKAREEWEKAGPAFEKFISTLSGGMQGAISQQFEQLRSQAEQFIDKAFKAGDFSAINRVLTAFSDAVIRETTAFRESFEGMLLGLESGLGPSSPFASAAQRIKSITDELQGFIDDARISFANDPIALAAGNNPLIAGGGETQVRSATEAAQQYLLSLLGAKP
ncbi:MAG: phage tail length tape measure family protein, partial [Hyphomicrobium sp.]|uniref:phage tail length tape measure family protein n=1 Tax=Hyphomicrobium sp. TaxID=82 RepID=UPI0035670411